TPSSADYFVYVPTSARPIRMFLSAVAGMGLAMIRSTVLGIGVATALYSNPDWMAVFADSPGVLLALSFSSLSGFGSFCAAIFFLTAVSITIPPTYSSGPNLHILDKSCPSTPRPLFTTSEAAAYTLCA
ncbi:hypothetical protein CDV57_09746, partial [Aspergillus fumigatus]